MNWLAASIWWAFALAGQAFAIAMAYEGDAVLTGKVTTISSIMAHFLSAPPSWVEILIASVCGLIVGALLTHFFNWRPN